jgi:hypothetical protein
VESSQSRASAGRTCLSVVKVPPDYAAHIPPILGGHPVTASAAKPFFPERKASERERESGHSPRDDHTETKVATYETEYGTIVSGKDLLDQNTKNNEDDEDLY